MKWTKKEEQELLHFAQASDHENNEDMFEYISDMLKENGFNRTVNQINSKYYKLTNNLDEPKNVNFGD